MGCRVWPGGGLQVIVETGKAVGSEGLVAGQVVDIKSEGQAEKVPSNSSIPAVPPHTTRSGPYTSQTPMRSVADCTKSINPSKIISITAGKTSSDAASAPACGGCVPLWMGVFTPVDCAC